MTLDKRLTDKQQAFVNEYLQCWNATEAARRAGYSEQSARQQGSRLLTYAYIAELIQARVTEMTMSADEALLRLTSQARASMADFVTIKHGIPFIDMERAEKANQLHLLKKFKTGKLGVEIELYDAQAALAQILKEQHLRSGEPTEITEDASLTDEARASRITALLDGARARRTGQPDNAEFVQ